MSNTGASGLYLCVLLASLDCDLECTLGCFAAECEAAGMRVSAFKSEALALFSGLLPAEWWTGNLVHWAFSR